MIVCVYVCGNVCVNVNVIVYVYDYGYEKCLCICKWIYHLSYTHRNSKFIFKIGNLILIFEFDFFDLEILFSFINLHNSF